MMKSSFFIVSVLMTQAYGTNNIYDFSRNTYQLIGRIAITSTGSDSFFFSPPSANTTPLNAAQQSEQDDLAIKKQELDEREEKLSKREQRLKEEKKVWEEQQKRSQQAEQHKKEMRKEKQIQKQRDCAKQAARDEKDAQNSYED